MKQNKPCRMLTSPITITLAVIAGIVALNLLRVAQPVNANQDAVRAAEPALPVDPAEPNATLARGLELYAQSCAACHGEKGLGDGTAAYLLYPPPRNLADGQFRISSTTSGLPSDDDLMQMLRRGMPGSSMPSWGHLPDEDLKSLVLAVRELAIQGKAEQLMRNSKTMKPDRALKLAHNLLDPGPVAPLPPKPPPDQIDLVQGQTLYVNNCAACHDIDGRGRNKRDLTDNSGQPVFARDFTAGIFKGGGDAESLARRIVRGMPGSPMPAAAEMTAPELWSMVTYIQTMVKPGAQERVEQVPRTFIAAHVNQPLSVDPSDTIWNEASVQFVPLMPLWWRDERIEGANVQALHDGANLAIRIAWADATRNEAVVGSQDFTDGVSVQVSSDENPPLFAMGQKNALVSIWYWKAVRQQDTSEEQVSLEKQYPNMPQDNWGQPTDKVYSPSSAAGNIVAPSDEGSAVECLMAEGFGSLTSRGPAAQVAQGGARRTADGWEVVFLHPLGTEDHADTVVLEPGKTMSIAFAVWDGAAGDRNGQKSVTIWHKLSLEK